MQRVKITIKLMPNIFRIEANIISFYLYLNIVAKKWQIVSLSKSKVCNFLKCKNNLVKHCHDNSLFTLFIQLMIEKKGFNNEKSLQCFNNRPENFIVSVFRP